MRRWCNEGKLDYSMNAAGQRVFDEKYLLNFRAEKQGITPDKKPIFYARSSSRSDVLIETQIDKLSSAYGHADKVFKDQSSGLNEKRKGLNKMLDFLEKENGICVVYITNKDRLTRFGFEYLARHIRSLGHDLVVLDSDDTKEPHEVLMQDFMSLLASFSGKFYRLRGWKQRQQFLTDVSAEVEKNVKNKQQDS